VSDFKTPMSVGQMSPETAGLIIEDVVATVLDIAVAAWPHLCQSKLVGPTNKEDSITDRLRWEMVAEKNRRDPRPQMRFERETQADDPPMRYRKGRIDVFVVYSLDDESSYFAIECKKISDHHNRRANYYVREGVCRFTSGKYSPGHPYGAMIAFVTRGTAKTAATFLEKKVMCFDENATRINKTWGWRSEMRFGNIPNLYSTEHGQEGKRSTILLLHLFLPFPMQN
jgi:hypothetical protein